MTDELKSNPVEIHEDGFTVNTKIMAQNVEYHFVYDDSKMFIKLTGEDLQVFSE